MSHPVCCPISSFSTCEFLFHNYSGQTPWPTLNNYPELMDLIPATRRPFSASNIEDSCTTLANLKAADNNDWFVKVFVLEKTPIYKTKTGRFQQMLVFTDEENSKMHSIIYQQDTAQLDKLLQAYQTYIIGNGLVKANNQYVPALTDSKNHIVLSRSSYIRPIAMDSSCFSLQQHYHLTAFRNCSDFADSSATRINLLCAVIHVFPRRFVQKRGRHVQDFVVVDQECNPLNLTMWEEFLDTDAKYLADHIHDMPVILAMRLSVTTYNGISLGTVPNSVILFDPPIPQAEELRSWLLSNRERVDTIVSDKLYEKKHQPVAQPHASQIRKISHITTMSTMPKSFWINAKITLTNSNQRICAMTCPGCSRGCGGIYGHEFTCFYCGHKYPEPKPLLRFEAELSDGTGFLDVHIEDREANEMLHMSAEELVVVSQKERNSLVAERLQHVQMLYHIKAFSDATRSGAPPRFFVMSCLPPITAALPLPSSEQQSSSSALRKIDPVDDQMLDPEESTSTGNKVPEDFALHGETSGNKRVVDTASIPESKCLKHAKQD